MESIQRIMIGAEVFGRTAPASRSLEHPTQRCTVNDAAMDAIADDAPCELVHYEQNPIRSQGCGLAAKQIAAPQAILHVAEEGEPGGTFNIRFRPVMISQDTANHVLVDCEAESHSDLLSDSGTSPGGISTFHLHDGIDELFGRPFRSWTTPALRRKQQAILSLRQHPVKIQQGGRLQNDGGAQDACRADEESAQTGDDPISGTQVRRAFAAAIQDQKLMPDKDRFSDHATKPAGLCQPDHGDDQMKKEIEEVAHPGNRNKTRTAPDFPPSSEFAMDTFVMQKLAAIFWSVWQQDVQRHCCFSYTKR
jgi:hypothetical protein